MMKKILLLSLTLGLFASCTKNDEDQEGSWDGDYAAANMTNGGIMFDRFWSTSTDFDQETNGDNLATLNASSDFFRCKQCHAWDGLGNKGSYINRSPKAATPGEGGGRPNVASLNLMEHVASISEKELFDGLKKSEGRRSISDDITNYDPETNSELGNKMPNLSEMMSDQLIWDLVKYLKEGQYDISTLADMEVEGAYPSGSFSYSNWGLNGSEETGKTYYEANCKMCHSEDGTKNVGGYTLGYITREKAFELAQKTHYGVHSTTSQKMPGFGDITINEMKGLYKYMSNEEAFPDPTN